MTGSASVLVLALTTTLAVGDDPVLGIGVPLESEIPADAPSHPAPRGMQHRSKSPWRGVAVEFTLEGTGPAFLTLRSSDFDAYLVLEDALGSVIAEDDDGFFGTHAQIAFESSEPGAQYVALVLAPDGFGAFTLDLDSTPRSRPSPEDAIRIAQSDLEIAESRDDRPLQAAHSTFALALAARAADRTDDAAMNARWAIQAYQSLLAPEPLRQIDQLLTIHAKLGTLGDPEVFISQYGLAMKLLGLGRRKESFDALEQTLTWFRHGLGDAHESTAMTHYVLGVNYMRLGHHSAGLPHFQRAKEIRLQISGGDPLVTADVLHNLAWTYYCLGHGPEAVRFGKQALDIRMRILGEEAEDTSWTTQNLVLALDGIGRHDEAFALAQRLLEVQFRISDPASLMHNLAITRMTEALTRTSQTSALKELLTDHHRRCVAAYGANDPHVAPSVARLAIFEWGCDRRDEALRYVDEALRIGGWEASASNHGNEMILFQIAEILRESGRLADAREFARYAVELEEKFHAGAPTVFQCRARFADILLELAAFEEAEAEYAIALDGYLETLGDVDPRTQEMLFGIARAMQESKRPAEAEVHYRRLLEIRDRVLPNDHPALQDVRLRLAEVLRAQSRLDEADRMQDTVTTANNYRPTLLVRSPEHIETTTESPSALLDAVITDYSGVADVRIVRDGYALSIRLLDEQSERPGSYLVHDPSGQKATLRFPLAFREGEDRIELVVSAQNRRGQWSDPQTFRITHRPPQRDLYLLAIGVQDYDDDSLDLAYPIADVDGIIEALSEQQGGFYSKVHVKRLVDREVTIGECKRSLDQFLTAAQPRDTIIVFVAGHGVRTEHSEYYFLTSDTTPADPYDGVDRQTIESLVTSEKLHALRRLLLLDTCHAGGGSPGGERTRAGAIRTLVQQDEVNRFGGGDESTGLYVFASSTDDSFAREADGHGLFTRAVLDGLRGEADRGALGDGNGLVEIEELKNYVYFQVLETSQGRQRTTVPKVISGENFPLGRATQGAYR